MEIRQCLNICLKLAVVVLSQYCDVQLEVKVRRLVSMVCPPFKPPIRLFWKPGMKP